MIDLLNQTCTIYKNRTKEDRNSESSWGFTEVVDCRFINKKKYAPTKSGFQAIADAMFQISEQTLSPNDKIDFNNTSFKVVDCQDWRGFDGELFGSLVLVKKGYGNDWCSNQGG